MANSDVPLTRADAILASEQYRHPVGTDSSRTLERAGRPPWVRRGSLIPFSPKAAPVDTLEAFDAVDIRVGTIVAAEPFPEARKPAFRLSVDFGPELGVRRSSAQITARYERDELVGKRVLAVVNFPPKRVAGFTSEVLVLGVNDPNGNVVLVQPEFEDVRNGVRLY